MRIFSASWTLVVSEGPTFERHVFDMIIKCQRSKRRMALVFSDDNHARQIEQWRAIISTTNWLQLTPLPAKLSEAGTNVENATVVAISELVHRYRWDKSLENNPDTEKFFVQLIRDSRNH